MKQVTKSEVLEQVAAFGREVERLKGEKELLMKGSDVLEKRALEQAEEITQLKNAAKEDAANIQRLTEANAELANHPVLRALEVFIVTTVEKAMSKRPLPGAGTPGTYTVQQSDTTVILEKVPKDATLTDEDLEGKILMVMSSGGAQEKWEAFELAKPINARWGLGLSGMDVTVGLQALFEKRLLGKVIQGKHTRYFIPENVHLVPPE